MNLLKRFSQIKSDMTFIKKMSGETEAIKLRPLTEILTDRTNRNLTERWYQMSLRLVRQKEFNI